MQEHNNNYISWDECFMRMARLIALRSKDPNSQNGAVVVDQRNVVVGLGYNGWPRGIKAGELPWEREGDWLETKYPYVCHAEENAIYNANARTHGCKLYCTMFPCNECAKTIIQNGIVEVIYELDKYSDKDVYVAAKRLFDITGIAYREYRSN